VAAKKVCVIDATGRKHCGRLVGASRNNPAAKRSRASASKTSLGARLVELGNSAAASDVQMLGLGPTASLDEVCRTLEATGQYREQTLRINALRGLATRTARKFHSNAGNAAKWLWELHPRLGVWAAAACARHVLSYTQDAKGRPRLAVEVIEAWVRGEATPAQVNKAAEKVFSLPGVAAYAHIERAYAGRSAYNAARSIDRALGDAYAERAVGAAAAVADAAGVMAYDDALRALIQVVTGSIVEFPVWQGAPADDRWPMTTAGKSL